jgi:hypothetical protein
MAEYVRKRLLVLFVTLALIGVSVVPAGQAIADATTQASQAKTLDRDLEPVIVEGSQVSALLDTPVEHLFVYTFSGNSLGGQIPVQVDERTAGGSYKAVGDGQLDLEDEIVFMAADLGDRPANITELYTLPISATWYEIEVTNPLSTTQKGWAYLVGSDTLTHISKDYVDYNSTTKRITTNPDHYRLGLATLYAGLDYLTLNGNSTDILDRTKIRAVFDAGFLGTVTLTEEALENPEIDLVKDGPVRVILQQSVAAGPGDPISEASLTTTNLAYNSLLEASASISFTLPGFVDLISVRTSVDLSSAASGATFYNANTPGGVPIDGDDSSDSVVATPFSNWAQVSHTTGRLIQVSDPTPAGGTQKNYYCDDNSAGTTECDGSPRTGANGSYGDAGILTEGNVNPSFTIESWLFVLESGQDNVGDKYARYFDTNNRLRAVAYLQGVRSTLFLPIILKNSP